MGCFWIRPQLFKRSMALSSAIGFTNTNPLDRDLSDEQLGPVLQYIQEIPAVT